MKTGTHKTKPVSKRRPKVELPETIETPVFETPVRTSEDSSSRINPWSVLASVAVIVALVVGGFIKRGRDQMSQLTTKTIPDAVTKITGGSMKLKTVQNVKEVSGVYQFEIVFDVNGNEQKYTSYITKDGKIVFTSGSKVDELKNQPTAQGAQKKMTCSDVKKADSGKLTAFVVSRCPYGLQMQRAMKMAIDEKPDLASAIDVKYIGAVTNGKITSMHGDEEAQENLRQICIREEQKEKYWPYVSCYMKAGKAEDCANTSGVNAQQLSACTADAKRGLAYAQKDFDIANAHNVSGSPTLIANGDQTVSEFDFGGRSPDALKQLVCCSSKSQPDFCKSDLSKDSVATAFSESDAGTTGGSAASCGI